MGIYGHVCILLSLFGCACNCGSIIPEPPPTAGSTPCDARGGCPGTLVCDAQSQECVEGTPAPPLYCPAPGVTQQTIILGVGLECAYVGSSSFAYVTELFGGSGTQVAYTLDGGFGDGGSFGDGGPPYALLLADNGWLFADDGVAFYSSGGSADPGTSVDVIMIASPYAGATGEGAALGMSPDQIHKLLGAPHCTSFDVDSYGCQGATLYYRGDGGSLSTMEIYAPVAFDLECDKSCN